MVRQFWLCILAIITEDYTAHYGTLWDILVSYKSYFQLKYGLREKHLPYTGPSVSILSESHQRKRPDFVSNARGSMFTLWRNFHGGLFSCGACANCACALVHHEPGSRDSGFRVRQGRVQPDTGCQRSRWPRALEPNRLLVKLKSKCRIPSGQTGILKITPDVI